MIHLCRNFWNGMKQMATAISRCNLIGMVTFPTLSYLPKNERISRLLTTSAPDKLEPMLVDPNQERRFVIKYSLGDGQTIFRRPFLYDLEDATRAVKFANACVRDFPAHGEEGLIYWVEVVDVDEKYTHDGELIPVDWDEQLKQLTEE